MRHFAVRLSAFALCVVVALNVGACDNGGSGMDLRDTSDATVESASAEWTSVPVAQIGDTITVQGEVEATLSDGSTRPADSAHVLWQDSLVHRVDGQAAVETRVFIESQGEKTLTLRAFASDKQDEASRVLAAGNPITSVEARWTSVPSVVADTVVAAGRAAARRSNGATDAADSAHVLWRGEMVHRVRDQAEIEVRFAAGTGGTGELALRAFASAQEDEATKIIEIDAAPPELVLAAEEGDDYGTVRGHVQSDETLSQLSVFLLNEDRTDSTLVRSKENVQEVEFDTDTQNFHQPGDTARFSAHGEDPSGNVAHETARGVVGGADLEVEVLRASSAPHEELVPQEATLTVIDNKDGTQKAQRETGASGEVILENLAVGDTVKANDNPGEAMIGDLYETNVVVEDEDDAEITMGMLPNVSLQPGDETYEHSLDLLFEAQHFDEGDERPAVLTIPPHDIPPDYEERTEQIYPMTFAINRNDKIIRGDHRRAIEDGVRSWNGPNHNYQHAKIIDDTTKADWTIRIVDDSKGLKREQRAIEMKDPSITSPPEPLQKEAAHLAYHALELGPFAHLESPRYIGSTSFGDYRFPRGATHTEVKLLHSLINLRTIYDSGRNLDDLFDPE